MKIKMKYVSAIMLAGLFALFVGCKGPQFAADSGYSTGAFMNIGTNAPTTNTIANATLLGSVDTAIDTGYKTLDAFVTQEANNRAALAPYPEVHTAAEYVRKNAELWVGAAVRARDAFRNNPSLENQATMAQTVAVINSALATYQQYQSAHPTLLK